MLSLNRRRNYWNHHCHTCNHTFFHTDFCFLLCKTHVSQLFYLSICLETWLYLYHNNFKPSCKTIHFNWFHYSVKQFSTRFNECSHLNSLPCFTYSKQSKTLSVWCISSSIYFNFVTLFLFFMQIVLKLLRFSKKLSKRKDS